MKTVIEMAREVYGVHTEWTGAPLERLTHFAELVRADEAAKYKYEVHSCGPSCTNFACMAVREAVEAERAACAELVFNSPPSDEYESPLTAVYNAIRARSST